MSPELLIFSKFALDVLVACLLAATIIYSLKLSKRIRILQDSKSELAQLIQKFDESTNQATQSINEIHAVSRKINEGIKARLEKANYIADDLAFMIEKGNKLANRMEADISGNRTSGLSSGGSGRGEGGNARAGGYELTSAGRGSASDGIGSGRIRQEREAMVQHASDASEQLRQVADQARANPEKRTAALEEMLNKVANQKLTKPGVTANSGRKVRAGARLRSKAEQELYDSLQTDQKV